MTNLVLFWAPKVEISGLALMLRMHSAQRFIILMFLAQATYTIVA